MVMMMMIVMMMVVMAQHVYMRHNTWHPVTTRHISWHLSHSGFVDPSCLEFLKILKFYSLRFLKVFDLKIEFLTLQNLIF